MGDNPWTYILIFAAVLVVLVLLTVVLNAFLVSRAGTRYAEKLWEDCRRDLTEMLPGKNCGACGFCSCEAYAEAVLHRDAEPNLCSCGGEKLPEQLDAYVTKLQEELDDPLPMDQKYDKYGRRLM